MCSPVAAAVYANARVPWYGLGCCFYAVNIGIKSQTSKLIIASPYTQ